MTFPTDSSSTDNVTKPKKRRISCLYLLLFLSILLIFPAFYLVCLYVPPLRISEETTRITEPLTSDGQIDFVRYLEETMYPPEWSTDDNGYRIFVRTFGYTGGTSNSCKEQLYKKLGLDIHIPPTMTLPQEPWTIITEYYKKRGETIPAEKRDSLTKPWTLEDWPMLADWVVAIDAPLDAVTEMIHKPIFFCPYLQDDESYRTGKSPELVHQHLDYPSGIIVRNLARQYQARANYRIAIGKTDEALDDIITIYQLGRKYEQGGWCITSQLVGRAIESVANAAPLATDSDRPLTKEQLQRLLDAVNQLPPRPPFEKIVETERIYGLSAIQYMFRSGEFINSRTFHPTVSAFLVSSSNPNVIYRRMNEAYDTFSGKRPRSEFTSYTKLPSTLYDALQTVLTSHGRGKFLAALSIELLVSNLEIVERSIQLSDCSYNMKRLTLALLIYKAEHGELPTSDWIEKIQPYLGENFIQYLRCPSCPVQEEDKTNYALILYDKLPKDADTFLLVELREPVPFAQAVVSVDDVLEKFVSKTTVGHHKTQQIGSFHFGGMNISEQNGRVHFIGETPDGNELRRQLGLEPKNEPNDSQNKDQ